MYVNRATLLKEFYESKTVFSASLGKFRRYGGQATPVMREYKTGLRIVLRGNDAIIPRDYRKKILLELLWQQYSAWPFFLADFLRSTVLPVTENGGAGQDAKFKITVSNGIFRVFHRGLWILWGRSKGILFGQITVISG